MVAVVIKYREANVKTQGEIFAIIRDVIETRIKVVALMALSTEEKLVHFWIYFEGGYYIMLIYCIWVDGLI